MAFNFDPKTFVSFLQEFNAMSDDEVRGRYSPEEIEEIISTSERFAGGDRPSFTDRFAAGFALSPEGEANIMQDRGVNAFTNNGELSFLSSRGSEPVDPKGFDVGDIADAAGQAPSVIGGVLGGIAGAPGGLVTSALGAGAGAGLGDQARQFIGRKLGSGEENILEHTATEGVLGMLGEGMGGAAGKFLRGPFKRASQSPNVKRTIADLTGFDKEFGTELAEKAPVDVQTGSDFLGNLTQRIRESQFGGQALREGQDLPFQRELAKGFENVTDTGTQRVGEVAVGADLKGAAESTLGQRFGARAKLFEEFRDNIDPTQAPDLSNTFETLREITQSNVLKRGKTGSAGVNVLNDAIEEASNLKTFDALQTLRQAVNDEVSSFDPGRLSGGAQGLLKKLGGALKADELAFLEAGGGIGSEAAKETGRRASAFAKSMFELDEAGIQRLFKDPLQLSDIATKLRSATPEEVVAAKQIVGASPRAGGLEANAVGGEAWGRLVTEILNDIKDASRVAPSSAASSVRELVISGPKMQSALNRFKDGSLDEILGKELAENLFNFADLATRSNVATRGFANFSKTFPASQTIINDLIGFFSHPGASAGSLIGRMLVEFGGGKLVGTQAGKKFLLGQSPLQKKFDAALTTTGRALGQSATQPLGVKFSSVRQDKTERPRRSTLGALGASP